MTPDAGFSNAQYLSDYYIQNASFFRMDCMYLEYTFPNVRHTKTFIRLSASVQNAFVITPYKGLDPEIANGIDSYQYPRARVFMAGIEAGF